MNSWVAHEYWRLRRKGWPAKDALRAARIWAAFTDAENEGLVRLRCEPEIDCVEDLEPDFDGICARKCDAERARKEHRERANREGFWILVADWRPTPEHRWIAVDSVGGFVGDDWKDSGYDVDLRDAALDALADYRSGEAAKLAERATYAAGGL